MPPRKNAMAGVEVVHKPKRRTFKAEEFDPEQIRSEIDPFATKLPSVAKQADQPPTLDNGTGELVLDIERNLETVDDFSGEVVRLWGAAGRAFIETGRALNRAKEKLAHGDFMMLTSQRLPFSHNIADRLMAIARAVDEGVYPADALPPNYTVAYQLVSLYDHERPVALKEGLVTPAVTRRAIEEFKKRMRQQDDDADARVRDRKRLASLIGQRARIEAEIKELQERLGEDAD
ncbi:DUF3102 domain-containing protein (plasmid) [Azospirillum sp. HJ39]|uniref:DUF3102 domain-containing protein n=1 Tax=Azospirillum sp. HJ39 TaxID=3159496 RepID=UPI00355743EF